MNQRKLFRKVIDDFNRNKIRYCVLRNYEFLTNSNFAVESLDTVVESKDMKRLDALFKKNGFKKRKKPQFSLKHHSYFGFADDAKAVSFDIQEGGVHWNDAKYIGEEIVRTRIKKSYFYVPSDHYTCLMLIVHSILGKRYFKDKYKKIIANTTCDKRFIKDKLGEVFGKKTALKIYYKIKLEEFDKIKTYPIVAQYVLSDPKRTLIISKLLLRWIRWKRFFKPKPLISIIGPDGAGKSTLTKELYEYLEGSNRKVRTIYTGRGREHILPMTKFGKNYKSSEKKKDKRSKRQMSTIKRELLYTGFAPVFALDLYLRYLFRIFPSRMKKNIALTDRYCSDIVLMQNVPFWFKNMLLQVFPKPTISIYLYNSAEELHKRRPEESVKELKRQMKIFSKFKYSLKLKTVNKKENIIRVKKYIFTELLDHWD